MLKANILNVMVLDVKIHYFVEGGQNVNFHLRFWSQITGG